MIQFPIYTVSFAATASAVALDFFELKAHATAGGLALLDLDLAQTTEVGDSGEEMVEYLIARGVGNTSGSGGSAPTPASTRSGAPAASFTAEVLNTTQAVAGGGSLTVIHRGAFNVRGGLPKIWIPEGRISCKAAESLVIAMVAAPTDSVSWVGTATVAELVG